MSLKLGIITDEVSQNLREALELAKEFNLDAVELRSVEDKLIHDLTDRQLLDIKTQVSDAGLDICALSTPIFKCDLDDQAQINDHHRILQRALRTADILDVPILRAFTFWRKQDFAKVLPRIVDEFRQIEPEVRNAGKTLVVEPDPSVNASNARSLRQVLEQVNSPHVRALYDPGNHLWDPQQEEPFPFAYEHLHPLIAHIHLKDGVHHGCEIKAVAIGEGEVGYAKLLAQLKKDAYPGYLVVETHYRLHRELEEEELKRPQGSDFSHGGMEASRQCLNSLVKLLP